MYVYVFVFFRLVLRFSRNSIFADNGDGAAALALQSGSACQCSDNNEFYTTISEE